MFEVLTIDQVAAALQVSKGHVSKALRGKLHNTPVLPHIRLGRRKLIRRSVLDLWMQQNDGVYLKPDDSEQSRTRLN